MWEKLVERKGDFLKNYLLYESLVEHFPRIFTRHHIPLLTVRDRDAFTHYLDQDSFPELALFLKEAAANDPHFISALVAKGEEAFLALFQFCQHLPVPHDVTDENLAGELKEYFRLYKAPYPYFNITIFGDNLSKNDIHTLAKFRFFARDQYNTAHKLIEPVLQEAALRLHLTAEQIKFLTPDEICSSLQIHQKIKCRQRCYFLYKDGNFELKEDETIMITEEKEEQKDNQIKGKGTFPAKYRGKVRKIGQKEDLSTLEKGEILLLKMITPDLISDHIKKASAIITDEGGATCHAAVVSREFNIPILMGTKNATTLLRNGDIVEVDTENGIARKIEEDSHSLSQSF